MLVYSRFAHRKFQPRTQWSAVFNISPDVIPKQQKNHIFFIENSFEARQQSFSSSRGRVYCVAPFSRCRRCLALKHAHTSENQQQGKGVLRDLGLPLPPAFFALDWESLLSGCREWTQACTRDVFGRKVDISQLFQWHENFSKNLIRLRFSSCITKVSLKNALSNWSNDPKLILRCPASPGGDGNFKSQLPYQSLILKKEP